MCTVFQRPSTEHTVGYSTCYNVVQPNFCIPCKVSFFGVMMMNSTFLPAISAACENFGQELLSSSPDLRKTDLYAKYSYEH